MIPFLQRFSEVAAKYPDRLAAVDHDGARKTTYAQFNDYSSRVASYLKTLGFKKEEIVAIKLDKSMEYVAVELGVMKCGCAFVPISDAMGQERIEHVLKDSGASFVFDSTHWDKAMGCKPLPEAEWADSDEHDLAFIIYTSGSTGMPKGVVEEYGAYRFMAKGTAEEVLEPYNTPDEAIRFANVAPVTFSAFTIIAVCMVCEAWTNYFVPEATVKNPLLYMQYLKDHRIDAMFLTASLVKPIGFCVLGGIFSEGIDLQGESLIGSIIVGTGIPMVCEENELIKHYFDMREDMGDGMKYAYIYPGFNKVLQAAGRVIRTHEDTGIVALLDQRFAYSSYRELYPREWSSVARINIRSVTGKVKAFWDNITEIH